MIARICTELFHSPSLRSQVRTVQSLEKWNISALSTVTKIREHQRESAASVASYLIIMHIHHQTLQHGLHHPYSLCISTINHSSTLNNCARHTKLRRTQGKKKAIERQQFFLSLLYPLSFKPSQLYVRNEANTKQQSGPTHLLCSKHTEPRPAHEPKKLLNSWQILSICSSYPYISPSTSRQQ